MDSWSSSHYVEVAMLVLVLFGAVFVALGFVSISAYHDAMGFPSRLFPPEPAMLGLMGFVYGVPAIFIIAVTPLIGLVGWETGRIPWFKRVIAEPVRTSKNLQWLMLISALIIVAPIIVDANGWLDIPGLVRISLTLVLMFCFGAWIANLPTIKLGGFFWFILCVVFVFLFYISIDFTAGFASYFGRQEVAKLCTGQPRFSTVIPFSGESYTPGKLIVCSERFCGFHDGRNPRILSLDGIKEIVP